MANEIIKNLRVKEITVDKSVCTVVSGIPFRLNELKPGLYPVGLFSLPPARELGKINSLVVKEGFYFRYVGDGKSIEQYEKAEIIANSIVNDYINAQVGVDSSSESPEKQARPALFWVYGEHTDESINELHADKVALALQQQRNWFNTLIKIADDDWNKHHQHKMISDLQRYAADALGTRREWSNINTFNIEPSICPACRSMIPGGSLICQVCRTIIDSVGYEKLGLKRAV